MRPTTLTVALIIALTLFLAGCGGGGGPVAAPAPQPEPVAAPEPAPAPQSEAALAAARSTLAETATTLGGLRAEFASLTGGEVAVVEVPTVSTIEEVNREIEKLRDEIKLLRAEVAKVKSDLSEIREEQGRPLPNETPEETMEMEKVLAETDRWRELIENRFGSFWYDLGEDKEISTIEEAKSERDRIGEIYDRAFTESGSVFSDTIIRDVVGRSDVIYEKQFGSFRKYDKPEDYSLDIIGFGERWEIRNGVSITSFRLRQNLSYDGGKSQSTRDDIYYVGILEPLYYHSSNWDRSHTVVPSGAHYFGESLFYIMAAHEEWTKPQSGHDYYSVARSIGRERGANPDVSGHWKGAMLGTISNCSYGGQCRNRISNSEMEGVIIGDALVDWKDFNKPEVDISFTEIQNMRSGKTYDDITWSDVAVEDGAFVGTEGSNEIRGSFYGSGLHDYSWVGGIFNYQNIEGAFGAGL